MNMLRFRWLYFILSGLVIVPGLISLAVFGLRLGIDFTGGTLMEIKLQSTATGSAQLAVGTQQISELVSPVTELSQVVQTGEAQFILRGKTMTSETKQQVMSKLSALGTVTELRFESVGPTLGRELLQKTLTALLLVSVIITWFVARQFKELKYGVSAILAMLHDKLVLVGSFSLLGHFGGVEVDVLFVTALLTTLSFSVHDTIVVFDRIRELHRKHYRLPFEELCNVAVLETMGRSLNNSLTIIFMLLALVLLGGETIRFFAVALLIGVVSGTYSSTFTAVPLLLVWDEVMKKRRKN